MLLLAVVTLTAYVTLLRQMLLFSALCVAAIRYRYACTVIAIILRHAVHSWRYAADTMLLLHMMPYGVRYCCAYALR